jgi:hypothetical protein
MSTNKRKQVKNDKRCKLADRNMTGRVHELIYCARLSHNGLAMLSNRI